MSFDVAYAHLQRFGLADAVQTFDVSSATVDLAAKALGCAPAHIAKTLSFVHGDGCLLLITAGDTRIDNAKFKAFFGHKASMLPADEVLRQVGHAVGGVCPFGVPQNIPVYLDRSLLRFDVIFPACGSGNSAVRLTPSQLESACPNAEWIDVCKLFEV